MLLFDVTINNMHFVMLNTLLSAKLVYFSNYALPHDALLYDALHMTHCHMSYCYMTHCYMTHCHMTHCHLTHCHMTHCYMTVPCYEVQCIGVSFTASDVLINGLVKQEINIRLSSKHG